MSAKQLITDHLDIWTAARKTRSTAGRGSSNKLELVGIKKLRELILELAVRGKLVPQDSDDEPASELLKKIATVKEVLISEGKIKREKSLPELDGDEIPIGLPSGWQAVRLKNICAYIQRGKGPAYADFGQVRVVSQKCVQWSGFDIEQARYVNDESLSFYQEERYLQNNDLLWNSTGTGTVGRIVVLTGIEPKKLVADSHVTVIRPIEINSRFLCAYISAPGIQNRIESGSKDALVSGSTNQVELNTSSVMSVAISIPPLAEQHRIVAKVDELMAFCDQLEQTQSDNIAAHTQLVEALLATLTNSADHNELQKNWQRIAAHFDTLFTTEHSIDQLKKTILQLAVMGKLVPQDKNDEPASELLKKIAAEKAQLIKEGKIKKEKPLPEITDEEKPFELPEGWEYVRFGSFSNEIATGPFGSMIHKSDYIDNGIPLINPSHMINGKIVADKSISVSLEKSKELNSYLVSAGDIVMARRGEMGRCAEVTQSEQGWLCGTGSFVLRFYGELSRSFITLIFNTMWVKNYLCSESIGTTMTNLNHGILNKMPLLVPPLSEQHRIVAKVDELMSLCDTLKTNIQNAQATQLHLADALVEQAVG